MILIFLILPCIFNAVYANSNTFAVIVCLCQTPIMRKVASSNFFRNYRHISNALSIYKFLREGNVPKENIILMIAGDAQCNARNYHFGEVLSYSENCDLMDDINISYQGDDVTLDSFIGVLTNKLPSFVSSKRRIFTNSASKVLIFINGHGGDNFFKFREKEELNADIVFRAINDMYELGRYGEILVVIDTCQASSLIPTILPPFSTFLTSSAVGEESFSLGFNYDYGGPLEDRFIHQLLLFLHKCKRLYKPSLNELMQSYLSFSILQSTAVLVGSRNGISICSFFCDL